MKGILFKPDMIKAIVEGRKTVTRRVCLGQRELSNIHDFPIWNARYQAGETVYIKEACCIWCYQRDGVKDACYKTDEDGMELPAPITHCSQPQKWRSPLFMPAWAARYFIQITGVRAERLQEIRITPSECRLEGSYWATDPDDEGGFINLWDSINKEHPWSSNPFVWVYTFRKVDKPVGIVI